MEDPNKVDTTTTDEATTEQQPAQETPSGPQLGKQLNKRPPKKQTPAASEAPPADPAADTEEEQTAPTTAPTAPKDELTIRAKALKTALRFGLPKKEDQTSSRPQATATRTEANLAAEAIAKREAHAQAKADALTANGKLYAKMARESALKGEAYCRERAQLLSIEKKREIEPAELASELEAALTGLERRLNLANSIKEQTVKDEQIQKAKADYSAQLMRISALAHPDHMLVSTGPNGEVSMEPAKLVLGNSARQALLILAVAPKEKIDEIIRETRRGDGTDSRKAFYDPKSYGALSALLKGGDEEIEVTSVIQTLAFDRQGETIERIRFAQLAADYAVTNDWNGAARCVDTLMGVNPVKRNGKPAFSFPKDTPIELVYHMIQSAIWKAHATACREEADRIRKEADQAAKRKGMDAANPAGAPPNTREKTEAARQEKTEPPPEVKEAPTEEDRAKAQTDNAIHAAKVELAHITQNHKPEDPWPKDKIRALTLSVAKYHPNYAEMAQRRKIHEQNPSTTDPQALTADQFKGFCIAFGRELLNLTADFKPETSN